MEIEKKDFDNLVEQLGKQASTQIKTLFDEAKANDAASFNELKANLEQLNKKFSLEGKELPDYIKNIQEQTNKLEASFKKSIEYGKANDSFYKKASDWLSSTEVKNLGKERGWKEKEMTFDLKAVGDMTLAGNLLDGDGDAGLIPAQFRDMVSTTGRRNPFVSSLIPVVPISSGLLVYYEENGGEGGTANKTELQKFAQQDYDFLQKTLSFVKPTVFARIPREMMEDASFLVNTIRSVLMRDFLIEVDRQALLGNGTTEMNGLYTLATAWDNDSFELPSGVTPNEADVLRVGAAQIETENFSPNYNVLNPWDSMKLDLQRDGDKGYLIPPFASADNQNIAGTRTIKNTGITSGSFLMGDFTRPVMYIRRGVEVGFKEIGTDAIYDAVHMYMSMRCNILLPVPDRKAMVKGTFSNAITALTASES